MSDLFNGDATPNIMAWLNGERIRQRALERWSTTGEMACDLEPWNGVTGNRQAPWLEVLDDALERAYTTPGARLMISVPSQSGKLIADDTPVATTKGWKRHGDLIPGDQVFHPDGNPVTITYVHPEGEASLQVEFTDGSNIVVHPRHEWSVYDGARKRLHTFETRELATGRLEYSSGAKYVKPRWRLPYREPLQLPHVELPVDPYTLGLWLGDGSSTKACITHHPYDRYVLPYPESARCVHTTTGVITTYYRGGLRTALKTLGVLGNKHIPQEYLRASEKQRRELLAGLIDSDGHCVKNGQVKFSNANRRLTQGVAELIRTLGYRAREHNPVGPMLSSSGIQGKQQIWEVTFSPHDTDIPLQLPRKIERLSAAKRRGKIGIKSITEVEPRPGRCITVDRRDGLYLVGEKMIPTHNSQRAAIWGTVRALMHNPERRIIIATNGEDLARSHSEKIRNILHTYGTGARDAQTDTELEDRLGIGLPPKVSSTRWTLAGHQGGLIAVGVGTALPGRPADMMILDDLYSSMSAADSKAKRREVEVWWDSVASQRLSPAAPLIVIGTKWNEKDIFSYILAHDAERWEVLNFPAIAEPGILDSLGRKTGEQLESVRGDVDWEEIKRTKPARVWNAMYQGNPVPPEGGLFEAKWFDSFRKTYRPQLRYRVVAIDPADTGQGDEVGVIAAGADAQGNIYLTEDWSAKMTSVQWANRAVRLALQTDAHEIIVEGYTAPETYKRSVREAWSALAPKGKKIKVSDYRARKSTDDAIVRSNGIRNDMEVGKCMVVGYLNDLESQAVAWQVGQHCPDRVAAAVIAHTRLDEVTRKPTKVVGMDSLPMGGRMKVNFGRQGRY